MKKFCVLAVLLAVPCLVSAEDKKVDKKGDSVLGFKMKGLDGKEVDLSAYKGKVILFVNVASKCGNTPQYKGLQAIYEKYHKQGFVVIGVPCNQFGGQEPGSPEEIAKFCESKYNVTFPLLAKVDVKGKTTCDLYKALKDQKSGEIEWNFAKFLVGKNGEVAERFKPGVKPEDKKIISKIEEELKK